MRRMIRSIVIVAMFFPATVGVAATNAEAGLKTWAVISSAKLQKAGLTDLLTTVLSREKGIKLVERDRLRLVAKELALSKMLGSSGVAQRAGAGRILKADALILLTDETKDGKNFVRLVISDCRCGARLRVDYLPFVPEKIEPLAGKLLGLINETRSRFPNGIKHVFGVPHFVSRNLVHDYDHLQAGFANLLGNALASMPGVAVIETEEAHRIRREINLTDGANVERIVPLFIEGEFNVTRPAKAKEPSVRISLKITDGARTVKTMSPKTMKLSGAGTFLREDVPRQILQIRKNHAKSLSVDEQFAALVSRADTFARLGFWKDSTGLREAALLLKPDAAEQRILIIKETYRIVTANWPRGTDWNSGRDLFGSLCHNRLARIHRTLEHVEYLIRNRQVSRFVAMKLVREETMKSISTIRASWSSRLTEEERRKKEFLANVYPLILDIPPKFKNKPGLERWQSILGEVALMRWDGNFFLKEDLDFLCKVLTTIIPDDLSPAGYVTYFLSDVSHRFKHGDRYKHYRFSPKEYLDFLSRLKQSGKPLVVIYSQYGRLNYEWVHLKDKNDKAALKKLLKRTEQLLAKCEVIKIKPSCRQMRRTVLYRQIGDMRSHIRRHLNPPAKTRTVQAKPTPRPKRSMGRLVFEEVPLRLKRLSGKVEPFKGTQHLLKCGDGLDVMWQPGAVLFMRKKGLVEEIFVDKQPYFYDVRWDGRNIWIGTFYDGIWIVSPEGKILTKIKKKHGLPCDGCTLLHPVAPGRACVIGTLGPHSRVWCAMVDFDGKIVKVNIFHRATRVPTIGEDAEKLRSDTTLVFDPRWVHEFNTGKKDGNRILLVGRHVLWRNRPLRIDLKTLRVSIFKHDKSEFAGFAEFMSSQSYFSRDGNLVQGKRLLVHDGWVYGVGLAWFRLNPRTWESERLNPGRLPYKYSILGTRGYHAVSAHYGLVAWDFKGTFYSISVKDLSTTTKPTSNNAGEKEWTGGCPYRVIVVKQPPSQTSK